METLPVAGTLHDTVGICYQTIPEAEEPGTSDSTYPTTCLDTKASVTVPNALCSKTDL